MPPVDVPTMRSKSWAVGRPVRLSISARTRVGMMPRMPPPSMERTRTQALGIGPSGEARPMVRPEFGCSAASGVGGGMNAGMGAGDAHAARMISSPPDTTPGTGRARNAQPAIAMASPGSVTSRPIVVVIPRWSPGRSRIRARPLLHPAERRVGPRAVTCASVVLSVTA